jgi:hypothetical protein
VELAQDMKLSITALSILSICISPSFTQLIPYLHVKEAAVAPSNQRPFMGSPNVVLPPPKDEENSNGAGDVIISDVISRERSINIFAGFTRDIDSISSRLDDYTQNSTVLAPLNSELQKLPQKPWEDPQDYSELGQRAYVGEAGEDRAHENLRKFVEVHVVPVSPWAENEKVETLGGDTIWWEAVDGAKVVSVNDYSTLVPVRTLMFQADSAR